jgi:hypothetical protein
VHQEVPNEGGAVQTIGTLKDRSGDRHLAVRYHRQLTHHIVPALHESHNHKGLTVEKSWWKGSKCNNSMWDRPETAAMFQQDCQPDSWIWGCEAAVGSLTGLQEVTGHCGGVGSLQNERRDVWSTALRKEQKRLWYTWTGLHLLREPLRTSGLKEVAAGAVGE